MNSAGVIILAMEYPPFLRGGLGTHVTGLTQRLSSRGIPVYVFAYSPQPLPERREQNITVITVSTDRDDFSKYHRDTLAQFYEIINHRLMESAEAFFRANKCDVRVIHCHDFHAFPAAHALRDLLGIPVICTVHLLHEPLMRWGGEVPPSTHIYMERLMCTTADHLICVCTGFRDLIRYIHPTSTVPISVIKNGIDQEIFRVPKDRHSVAREARLKLGIENDRVIVFAGRFTAQKSVVEIIESAHSVQERSPRIVYLLAGYYENADYARAVRSAMSKFPLSRNKFRFLGKLSKNEVIDLYLAADLAIVPSLYEGVPYAALEAMALGVPVVASNTCGISDLIRDRYNGLLVPTYAKHRNTLSHNSVRSVDVNAFADSQLEVLDDDLLAETLSKNALESITENYNLERMTDDTIQVYNRF